ncbi:TetR/AcrR family transcriptional regulator [Yinghuangia sp. ASG 101]|uniref:TetR/AcrR family transcriptional regulator n=1 Tax=Yinghuangia sp. ASG 101 TaxID=2896848 RepID=UPI001E64B629|nr:TetR/AcrR family transcriptional regulator [Yinghuangia sp. ASG 101]UGQ10998.1 TetR/AcrR family transcriptional regulator [Yinghuangia sp. ASG 101]
MTTPKEQPTEPTQTPAGRKHRASSAERATHRSPAIPRSQARSAQQSRAITRAARRLIIEKGLPFTTAELTKESGVALQTIYRHFDGKDQVVLAVMKEVIAEHAVRAEAEALLLNDPVARLRLYITGTLNSLRLGMDLTGPQCITAEHWRLYQLFPDDVARATQPFGALIERELVEAAAQGLLTPQNPTRDAWVAIRLVTATYHHYAFATVYDSVDEIADQVWAFCLAAFGGAQAAFPRESTISGNSRFSGTEEVGHA